MDTALKAALDKIEKAVADERSVNEERIAELKKTGAESPETKSKLTKAETDIADLIKTVNDHAKAISRVQLGPQTADAGGAAVAAHASQFFRIRGELGRTAQPSADQVARYASYVAAYTAYLVDGGQKGETLPTDIRAALSVGSDADGGFVAPTEMLATFQTRMFETSDVRAVATVRTTTRNSIEFPVDVNKGTSGGWVKERASRTETDTPRLGVQEIETHEQWAEPAITQTLLDDAALDIAGWLTDKTVEEMGRQENTAFVSGNGIAKPRGFMDYRTSAVTTADASRAWGALQYIAIGAAGAFPKVSGSVSDNPDALIDTIAALKPMYRSNARWSMNRATEATVRKLKDAEGRYLVGFGNLSDGTFGFNLLGFPITTMEDMPAVAADAFPIAFGDFRRGYTIVDRVGFRVLRDPYTNKPFVKFYVTKRVGADVTDFDALKLVKFAAS